MTCYKDLKDYNLEPELEYWNIEIRNQTFNHHSGTPACRGEVTPRRDEDGH